MQNIQSSRACGSALFESDPPRQFIDHDWHSSHCKKPIRNMVLHFGLCHTNLRRGGFLSESPQLQSIGQLKLTKRSQQDGGREPSNQLRSFYRMRVEGVQRNKNTGVRVNLQYSPRCIATNSAPVTFVFLLP